MPTKQSPLQMDLGTTSTVWICMTELRKVMNKPEQWVVLTLALEALLRTIAQSPCHVIKTTCIILTIMNHIFAAWCGGLHWQKATALPNISILFYVWHPLGRLRLWDPLTRHTTINSAVWQGSGMMQRWVAGSDASRGSAWDRRSIADIHWNLIVIDLHDRI